MKDSQAVISSAAVALHYLTTLLNVQSGSVFGRLGRRAASREAQNLSGAAISIRMSHGMSPGQNGVEEVCLGKKAAALGNYMGETQQPLAMESGHLQATDSELVRRARRGDHAAFHELVDRYASPLYGLAVSLIGNEADAEDVLQETFTGAYRGLGGFKGRSSAKTWLARILVRQVARHFRSSKRRSSRVLRLDAASLAEPVAPATPRPDVGMDVDAAIQSLSAERREVIVLREIQGMSYEEISQALGIPRGTVESRLFRARKELQERLSDYLT